MDEGKETNLEANLEAHHDDKNNAFIEVHQKALDDLVNVNSHDDKNNAFIEVHQKALDDLVNVNSLFTMAVFIGLAFANPSQRSLENRPECDPDLGLEKRLVIYEVNSFACFLFSSLVAKAVKVLLNIRKEKEELAKDHVWIPDRLYQRIFLSETWNRLSLVLSVLASLSGVVLLTLSMVNVIQIRVGKLTCGSTHAILAVAPLCTIVFAALLFYVPSMIYAVVVSASKINEGSNSKINEGSNSKDMKAPAHADV